MILNRQCNSWRASSEGLGCPCAAASHLPLGCQALLVLVLKLLNLSVGILFQLALGLSRQAHSTLIIVSTEGLWLPVIAFSHVDPYCMEQMWSSVHDAV